MNQLNKKMGKNKFVLFAVVIVLGIAVSITMNWNIILAATYNWTQSIPSLGLGGLGWVTATSTNASHLANQTNWQYYSSKDAAIATSSNGIELTLTPTSWTQTSGNDFKTTGYSASSTLSILSAQGDISLFICGNSTFGKIEDADSNIYNTVQIGTQCWMKENMRTTKYPNGTSITRGPTTSWSASDLGYYGYPPNVSNNAEETLANIISNNLGFMYQWSAAMNGTITAGAQGICPTGWHIPTDSQQDTLDRYYWTAGGSVGICTASRSGLWECDPAGTQLKSTAAGMFSGLLAGYRNTASPWLGGRGASTYFWSSTQSSTNAWFRGLVSTGATVYRDASTKAYGFSVRCLKD